ncbi:tyrosine-protein phosphatase corkscrew [Salpingoeca rosetta]|uniref:protein-tyrosine-phosphatase n=1 Tax=Salpingoeca rosetta (strain ATCC 50818 / BSB-021) TaxID=946362 RepID=F2TXY6_SALR5|nr:tyrosine-protein phosphatase corkscrew [Salpingoeca rosetta]EGD76245.1 tyrosine-protein phosphatase corkscrew [Salpingoeca rosetta]|eukprot:XP_004998420.1 tyrosine-protein phosphatase corkscrew [Salpingoeca rosetta]
MARRWFHPTISGLDAEKLLKQYGKHGSFLVRSSQTNKNDYALSVLRGDSVLHVKIQNTGDFYDLYGGEKFANLSELISYYTQEHNTLKEKNGNEIELLDPLLSEDPTSERWFHGNLSSRESEEALMQRGQDGSYLVRTSSSQPGRYVLTVRVKNEVTHIMIRAGRGVYDLGGGQQFCDLASLIEHYKKHPIIEANSRVVKLVYPFNATRLTLSAIAGRFDELSKESDDVGARAGFFEEFEQLQQMEAQFLEKPRIEGTRPENKPKNRYKNILPYDETRVKLRDVGPEVGADYINANYVNGEAAGTNHAYIASQGCMPTTVPSFWQMIWENDVHIVVMVTKEVERGRHKCTRYWPDNAGDSADYGGFRVLMQAEEDRGPFIIRTLVVQKGSDPARTVYQYHYTNWPDHGVPDDAEILSLLLTVREHNKDVKEKSQRPVGPLLVHCSAGIGRTGTIIVIDIIMDKIEQEGTGIDVDIQKSIQGIRAQRSGMIQTAAQYRFVYKAILDHINNLRSVMEGGDVTTDRQLYEDLVLRQKKF